jgi:predicted DNA-binding transcriptional regulator YafY
MNRIERLTAILIQLQSKRIVKAQEIADRFEISLRTVYRDVRALEESGVPIIGEAGVGYSIMEGYRLPPVMFTKEEATTFLMAEKIMEKYADLQSFQKYQSALFKIKSVLRSSEKRFLEEIDTNLLVLKNNFQAPDLPNQQGIQHFLDAIIEKRVIQIAYKKEYEQEGLPRMIEPVGIYLQNNLWYCIAFCRLRNDYRNFRIDRIMRIDFTNLLFSNNHPTLAQYLEKIAHDQELQTIVIWIEKQYARYLGTRKYYFGFVSEEDKGDKVEMTFLTASIEGFARWFITLAGFAKIIKPDFIKERVKKLATEVAESL